jgi:hypothetical protein
MEQAQTVLAQRREHLGSIIGVIDGMCSTWERRSHMQLVAAGRAMQEMWVGWFLEEKKGASSRLANLFLMAQHTRAMKRGKLYLVAVTLSLFLAIFTV